MRAAVVGEKKEDPVKRASILILACLLLFALASVAQAQATRTWVSGVGDDANPCSRTAPCKTFAGAISKTANGGIIDVLDPGGFGGVTITKSITIDGSEQIAGVLVSGTNAIVINAQPSDVVVLRNLEIHGVNTGLDAIRVIQVGELYVENCRIQNFTSDAIETLPQVAAQLQKVVVRNCDIRNVGGAALRIAPTISTANVKATLVKTQMSGSTVGVLVGNLGNSASLYDCDLSHNSIGIQVEQTNATAFISNSTFAYNGTAIQSGIAGLTPVTRIKDCTIVGSTANGIAGSGTVVGIGGGNMIIGNTGSNSVSSSVAGQ